MKQSDKELDKQVKEMSDKINKMSYKTESQLQHALIMWFSREYPDFHGLLFECNNDTYSRNHAMKRRSMGMISGASDLIFIIPNCGKIATIELKARDSTHSKNHIKNQLNWGENVIMYGGFYLITSCLGDMKDFIEALIIHDFKKAIALQNGWLKYVELLIKNSGKSVIF